MKKLEYAALAKLGATKEQLNIYSNTDPLDIYINGDGTYSVTGVIEAREITGSDLLGLLDSLGD